MTGKTISPLRHRMIEDMMVRNFDPRTQRSYILAVRRLTAFCQRRSNFRPVRRGKIRPVARLAAEAKSPLREGGFLLSALALGSLG